MKNQNLVISGACILLAGLVVLFSQSIGVSTAKFLVPALFIIGGIFAYIFSVENKQIKIASQFHLIQAFMMVIFGIVVAIKADSLESFLTYVTYFVLCIGFLDIGYGLMALSSNSKAKTAIVTYRMVAGFVALIGALAILISNLMDPMQGLMVAGLIMIFGGISIIIFARKIASV